MRDFVIFPGLIPVAYNQFYQLNQIAELQSRFCEVFALSMECMLEV